MFALYIYYYCWVIWSRRIGDRRRPWSCQGTLRVVAPLRGRAFYGRLKCPEVCVVVLVVNLCLPQWRHWHTCTFDFWIQTVDEYWMAARYKWIIISQSLDLEIGISKTDSICRFNFIPSISLDWHCSTMRCSIERVKHDTYLMECVMHPGIASV